GSGVVEVVDTGIGISLTDESSLFTDFYRGENAREAMGSGIGLSLSRALAELSGGSVAYRRNTSGQGSTFSICYPLATGEGVATTIAGGILVLDDNPTCCRATGRSLHAITEDVRMVSSNEEAHELLDRWRPSVVVTDYFIGTTTSESVLERVSCWNPAPRIVVLSAASRPALRRHLERRYGAELVEKPVEPDDLLRRVRTGESN
ncbi:MAG: response regulator, partial [Bdellovibrionales bacterium]|nr:response regulator [Bdellovibrionales bacterium]